MRRFWTPDEDATVKRLYADMPTADLAEKLKRTPRSVYQRAELHGLKKSAAYLASEASSRWDGKRGGATRFQAGHSTWNKGTHWNAGGRSVETQFKKGHLSGAAAAKLQPVGATRIADGQLQRKVNEDLPYMRRWVSVARLVWEGANGPIPAGQLVVFKPGMATVTESEITLDRLELVTRAENMRRNSYHTRYPKELARLIQLRGAMNRQINKRAKA